MKNKIYGQDANMKVLTHAIKENLSALLVGETGTGKTSMVYSVAEKLDKEVLRFNLNGQTSSDEFVGKYLAKDGNTYWQDGVLLQAMRKGKVLLVDEINAALPEILFIIHSLLDDDRKVVLAEKDGEVILPHKNFRFVATMNPVEEYAGTKDLNKAFVSRFNVVITVGYPQVKSEKSIVKNNSDVSDADALRIVMVGNELRSKKAKNEIFFNCSTRDLIHWAKLISKFGFEDSFVISIANKSFSESDKIIQIAKEVDKKFMEMKIHIPSVGYETLDKYQEVLENEISIRINKIKDKELELEKREKEISKTEEDIERSVIERLVKSSKKNEQQSIQLEIK